MSEIFQIEGDASPGILHSVQLDCADVGGYHQTHRKSSGWRKGHCFLRWNGPGYRLYFVRQADVVVVMLGGGNKASQKRDIATAKAMAKEL
jgi:hypothetical protein